VTFLDGILVTRHLHVLKPTNVRVADGYSPVEGEELSLGDYWCSNVD